MVSFLCHACGDVIKKPKLDQHHGRCHAGFDCIDCSVTFKTPNEYRSHTSCISEAEKYQKSLYKGPKQNKGNDDDNRLNAYGNSNGYAHGDRGGRGGFRGQGRGRFEGRGGRQGGGRPRDEGTGANGTPLGTPQRMSPVIAVPDNDPSKPEAKNGATDASSSSLPSGPNGVLASSPAKDEESRPPPEKHKKEKKHKDKKSKSKPESKEPDGEVKVNESGVVEATTSKVPLEVTEKKKKKRKHEKGEQPSAIEVVTDEQAKSDGRKEKKKTKGEYSSVGDDSQMEVDDHSFDANGGRKRKPKENIQDTDVSERPSDGKEKKKKKKRKTEEASDEPTAQTAEPATEPLQNKASEKKSKKRKKEGEREEVAEAEKGGAKGTKKSPKESHGTIAAGTESTALSSGKKRKREEKVGGEDDDSAPELEAKKEKKRKHSKE